MKKKLFSIFSLIILISVSILATTMSVVAATGFSGPYEMQNWSSSGIYEGITTISPSSGPATIAEFSYEVDIGPAGQGVTYRETTFTTVAAVTGLVSFDWDYTFMHSWYHVFADLWVFADSPSGPTDIHLVDFYNLEYTGWQTFIGSSTIWVEEGYEFGFRLGGSNFDYSGLLWGYLTVSNFGMIVEVDIKPGSYPNSINPDANGVIPIAILTTSDFDASTVDPETVALEGINARGKGKSGIYGSLEDVDGDGDLDLVVQVVNEIDWDVNVMEAKLTGMTWDGVAIIGMDSVSFVPLG